MEVTNPQSLIEQIPLERWDALKGHGSVESSNSCIIEPPWVEPAAATEPIKLKTPERKEAGKGSELKMVEDYSQQNKQETIGKILGRIQRLGDFVDTDAVRMLRWPPFVEMLWANKRQLAPAQYLLSSRTTEAMGSHCLEFTNPDFRNRVKQGYNVVVAGKAFGCGSSREQAVLALLGRFKIKRLSCSY
jgi:hypothetical protein